MACGDRGGGNCQPACPSAFTLIEMLMAMMVVGVILSAVVMLSQSLANYNHEGEAAVELSTHARFALSGSRFSVQREVRAGQALAVSNNGGLVIWMGDLDGDRRMALREFIIIYHDPASRTVRRVAFQGGPMLAGIGDIYMSQVVAAFDSGSLTSGAPAGHGKEEMVICRHADLLLFRPNRLYPQTLAVEYMLQLSRQENRIESSGRDIAVSFYGSATMRVPYKGDGLDP